jgi:hypothetical protein
MKNFEKTTVRRFNLSLVAFVVSAFALWTLIDPKVWAVNLIIWPIALLITFDRGHAKAIDDAYREIKHLKGKSNEADLMLVLLAQQNLKLARTKLLLLGVDFPEDKLSIDRAISAIDEYLKKKPWWHF